MITLKDVSKSYTEGAPALSDINIQIDEGEFVFVVGDSGSGKSTLIKLLLKELEPTSGTIVINDKILSQIPRRQIPRFRRNVGCVFQDFRLLKDRNVYENVAFAQRVIEKPNRVIKKARAGSSDAGRTGREVQILPEGAFRRRAAEGDPGKSTCPADLCTDSG